MDDTGAQQKQMTSLLTISQVNYVNSFSKTKAGIILVEFITLYSFVNVTGVPPTELIRIPEFPDYFFVSKIPKTRLVVKSKP